MRNIFGFITPPSRSLPPLLVSCRSHWCVATCLFPPLYFLARFRPFLWSDSSLHTAPPSTVACRMRSWRPFSCRRRWFPLPETETNVFRWEAGVMTASPTEVSKSLDTDWPLIPGFYRTDRGTKPLEFTSRLCLWSRPSTFCFSMSQACALCRASLGCFSSTAVYLGSLFDSKRLCNTHQLQGRFLACPLLLPACACGLRGHCPPDRKTR